MNEWINVKDKLPEEDELVLAFPVTFTHPVNTAEFLEGYFWICNMGIRLKPVYWMPLPDPPEDSD